MRLITIIQIAMLSLFFGTFGLKAQETKEYWFEGYLHTPSWKANPFCTVLLRERSSDKVKAVTLSSPAGLVEFRAVPIDIYKEHVLSVYQGEQLMGHFLQEAFKSKPQFKGNINSHIQLEATPSYKERVLTPEASQRTMTLGDYLASVGDIEQDNGVYFLKGSDAPLKIFVNHHPLSQELVKELLEKGTMNLVRQVVLVALDQANKYFSGAISIILTQGNIAEFSRDQIHNKLERIE